ncbi:MAG: EF-hand domain-containing protein [Luteolibacter sp.]
MKTHIHLALIPAILWTIAPAHAQEDNSANSGKIPRNQNPNGINRPFHPSWMKADEDKDGTLSREEFDAMPRLSQLSDEKRTKLFERLDKDGDGKLSHNEVRRNSAPMREARPEPPVQRLAELDTDQSGGVSMEEFMAGPLASKLPSERIERIFQRLDQDGDGQITPSDRPGPPEKPARPMMFQSLDLDGDKWLTFDEFRALPGIKNLGEDTQEDRFEALDQDSDGKISPSEFRSARPPAKQ